ncbi:hypothetical protein CCYA_CCYA02G0614 [Cyanidiococcus yangmingshanensis]|nr:hypothetical protein CCYA_CCYA02G0614 [Cyanidiococcus yangmingshanensis]
MPGVIAKLLLLSVLKKAAVFAVAKTYGFPRLYRRLMELNRKIFRENRTQQVWLRARVQCLFRLPRIVVQRLRKRPEHASRAGLLVCLTTAAPGHLLRLKPDYPEQGPVLTSGLT